MMTNGKEREIFIEKYISKYISKEGKTALYIHTPYCLRKCKYCVYHSNTVVSYDAIEQLHIQAIMQDLEKYSELFEHVRFDEIYFGGGTPTIMSPQQMDRLFNLIPEFANIPNKCLEASPEMLLDGHLELLSRYSFKFLSLGIQSLNQRICDKQNRYYLDKRDFISICKRIEARGIPYNLDFICFMDNGDIRDLRELEKEIVYVMQKTSPSFITIQSLYQTVSTMERSSLMIKMLRNLIEKSPRYVCVNSLLKDDDSQVDALYNTEYRLGLRAIATHITCLISIRRSLFGM